MSWTLLMIADMSFAWTSVKKNAQSIATFTKT
jgi:hypothetical protein